MFFRFYLQPHDVNMSLLKPKRKKNEENGSLTVAAAAASVPRKNSTPIVQLMPPPVKVKRLKKLSIKFFVLIFSRISKKRP